VLLWDERNSTKKATEHLKFNLGLKSSQIKKHKDKFSAVVILQDYLDSL
jgi:RNase H-fold protein (predicted Holliday junction resolvase)